MGVDLMRSQLVYFSDILKILPSENRKKSSSKIFFQKNAFLRDFCNGLIIITL